eukprot:6228471-Amphidinium_carterae.2
MRCVVEGQAQIILSESQIDAPAWRFICHAANCMDCYSSLDTQRLLKVMSSRHADTMLVETWARPGCWKSGPLAGSTTGSASALSRRIPLPHLWNHLWTALFTSDGVSCPEECPNCANHHWS